MVSNTSGIENNQELQNDIFEIAFIGMLIFSEEGKVIRYNKEAASVFEYNERLTGKSFEDLFVIDPATNPMNVIFGNKTVKDSYWENIIQIRNNKENVLWSNIRLNTIKGTDKYERLILCQILKTSAPDNPEANHEFYYHLLLELINNIPDNIFIKDAKSRFILANTCVAELIGAESPKMLLGKTDFDFFPKKLAGKYRNDEVEIIETGKAKLNIIEQVIDNNHNLNWFSTSKLPLKNEKGAIIGIMGIGRNITALVKEQKALRKAKHDAEKADRLKSAFLANLSHEIRTPLNGILGFSQFLTQFMPADPKVSKYTDFILQNGKRLLNLISDIIDVSKLESNQLILTKKIFSLNEILYQLENSITEELKIQEKTHIKLYSKLALTDSNCYIYSDDQRLRQVIYNLLANAVKFTQQGRIDFGYRLENKTLNFYVKDTGIGIKEENHRSIFELFTQVDNSLGRQYEGTGLGLSIAKGIVHLMGGKIGVNSRYGKGSEFYFTVPYITKAPGSKSSVKNNPLFEDK